MCRLLKISKSGFYGWLRRPMSNRARSDIALTAKIHAIHRRSHKTYGAPTIHAELADDHRIHVGCKRVARLMRLTGLRGVQMKRFVRTTTPDACSVVAVVHVDRCFQAPGPDRLCGGYHLHPDLERILVSLHGAGCLVAKDRRAGRWRAICARSWCSRRPTWHLRNADPRTSSTTAAEDVSTRVTPSAKRCQEMNVMPSMGSVGDALRQCDGRELLRSPRARSAAATIVQDAGRSPHGSVRMDRRLVQPASSSLIAGLSLTGQLRKETVHSTGGLNLTATGPWKRVKSTLEDFKQRLEPLGLDDIQIAAAIDQHLQN
jgi:putative transposase